MEHCICGVVRSNWVGLKVKERVSFPSSFPVKIIYSDFTVVSG